MDKKIKNIGSLSGKLLLFGGVYSNLQALEAVIALANQMNIPSSHCFHTGDLVGYCAQPEACVQQFRAFGAHTILGNVEIQLKDGEVNCGCDFTSGSRCDTFSNLWYPYAQDQVSKESLAWMKTIPDHILFKYAGKQFGMVHGSYNHVSDFIFKSTDWAMKQASIKALDCDVIIAGHSGLPFEDCMENKYWINPGVVGMPANDGQTHTWCVLLDDTDGLTIQFVKLQYNKMKTINLMKDAPVPQAYAETLATGLWDNMEILPKQEQALKGKKYAFGEKQTIA